MAIYPSQTADVSQAQVENSAKEAIAPRRCLRGLATDSIKYVSRWCKAARDFVNRKVRALEAAGRSVPQSKGIEIVVHSSGSGRQGPVLSLSKHPSFGNGPLAGRHHSLAFLYRGRVGRQSISSIFNGPEWLSVMPTILEARPGRCAVSNVRISCKSCC